MGGAPQELQHSERLAEALGPEIAGGPVRDDIVVGDCFRWFEFDVRAARVLWDEDMKGSRNISCFSSWILLLFRSSRR